MKRITAKPGDRYGRLTVISRTPAHITPKGRHLEKALCVCDCGNNSTPFLHAVISGKVKSCGCLKVEKATTHAKTNTPEYSTWLRIRRRCRVPGSVNYDRYGSQGVTICDRWFNSFEAFFNDMGEKPSPTHSIDRIDNSKGYEPGNCRWATKTEQAVNRRSTILITHKDRTLCINHWAKQLNVDSSYIQRRLKKGFSFEEVVQSAIILQEKRRMNCHKS